MIAACGFGLWAQEASSWDVGCQYGALQQQAGVAVGVAAVKHVGCMGGKRRAHLVSPGLGALLGPQAVEVRRPQRRGLAQEQLQQEAPRRQQHWQQQVERPRGRPRCFPALPGRRRIHS